ncbi:MAG: TIGR03560 family F420-dependent LLM class oxidoreductase [Chloroflexi bacterium]|nr:TIGR03560 family F420-dependent LLM class oxidoreductase [Chloroflexota bacterium]
MIEGQEGISYDGLLSLARQVEAAGWGGLFRSDHWLPIQGQRTLDATDAWSTLAGLARETSRIRLGALVSPMTFRHPTEFAKIVATVDQMSGGRIDAGFGAGWYEGEHQTYGLPFNSFRERFDRMTEAIDICTSLWSPSESTSFSGAYYQLDNAPGFPKPLQQPMPVIVGGKGAKRTPALTARYAREYNTGGLVHEWVERRDRVKAACEAIGRDPASLRYTWMTATCIGLTEADAWKRATMRFKHAGLSGTVEDWVAEQQGRGMTFGSVEQAAERLRAYAEAGAERFYLQIVPAPEEEHVDLITRELIPRVVG